MRHRYSWTKMAELFANSDDPDQTPRFAASALGLHCLPVILLRVSRLQRVNWGYSQYAFRHYIDSYLPYSLQFHISKKAIVN